MLTAEQLKITPAELAALLWVRDKLVDGTLLHHAKAPATPGSRVFDMGKDFRAEDPDEGHCGTVGCIGGWMALHMNNWPERAKLASRCVDSYLYPSLGDGGRGATRSRALEDLFFPNGPVFDQRMWSSITADEAVETINRFLATGTVIWRPAPAEC